MALLGKDAKLMYAAAVVGTPATTPAGMTVIGNVKDLSADFSAGEADVTTRGNGGWRATLATLRESTITFGMVWDTEDAAFTAIQTAFLTSGLVGFAVLDQLADTTGSQGLIGNFSITNFSQSQNLEEAQMVDVTIKLAEFGAWYKKTS
jgi:hypothetical protein